MSKNFTKIKQKSLRKTQDKHNKYLEVLVINQLQFNKSLKRFKVLSILNAAFLLALCLYLFISRAEAAPKKKVFNFKEKVIKGKPAGQLSFLFVYNKRPHFKRFNLYRVDFRKKTKRVVK